MGKNIVVFSDGTGQRSGISFDERRSNVYKLYRACRCGPDSSIDPAEQVAFYDPGVGTAPPGSGYFREKFARIKNMACMATGLGLTDNLIDCYAAIIRHWRPGDRIYLFGFSRGAYTVRLLGGVLSHCGVPTKEGDGDLPRSEQEIRRIAKEGVTEVYQHTASVRLVDYYREMLATHASGVPSRAVRKYAAKSDRLEQRRILAAGFRAHYGSEHDPMDEYPEGNIDGESNVVPYFIGAFDTVASMFHPMASFAIAGIYCLALLAASLIAVGAGMIVRLVVQGLSMSPERADDAAQQPADDGSFYTELLAVVSSGLWGLWDWLYSGMSLFSILFALTLVIGSLWYVRSHTRSPGELRNPRTGRIFTPRETRTAGTRMVFEDRFLSSRVPYARHAIAVDETRDMFDLVRWEHEGKGPDPTGDAGSRRMSNLPLREMCFAGSHTDVGGGYPEDESRLSDIALEWMAREARAVGLQVDRWYFQLWPDPLAIQHDEMAKNSNRTLYKPIVRSGLHTVELHPSLEKRVRAETVLYSDREAPYRPAALDGHPLYSGWLPRSIDDLVEGVEPLPVTSVAGTRDRSRRREERDMSA